MSNIKLSGLKGKALAIQNKDIPKTIIIPFQKFNNEFSKNGKFKRYVLKIEETYMCSDVRESKPIKRKRGRQKKQIKK